MPTTPPSGSEHFALIIRQPGKPQQVLFKYATMILNYRYGMDIALVDNLNEGVGMLRASGKRVSGVFVIQNDWIQSKMAVKALTLQGAVPLFLLCPTALTGRQIRVASGVAKVLVCAWEKAFGKQATSLAGLIEKAFREAEIDNLVDGEATPEDLQKRVESRVRGIRSMPSLPEILLRIMKLTNDPKSSVEALEELLISDVAIVQKLLELINSPLFVGAGHRGSWTLKEAIVRMGLKKVGALAQQVKLMNSFSNPDDSDFDMKRFWEHSVGCAMMADKILSSQELNPFEESDTPEFDDYWIGAILHDIGKLVLGQFFWDHFQRIVEAMVPQEGEPIPFREAEAKDGDLVNHEYVGQIVMMKSQTKEELIDVVKGHHKIEASSSKLVCIVSLVDNICKDLGMAYLPDEPAAYSVELLAGLGMDQAKVDSLKENLATSIVPEIKALVAKCL